MVMILWVIALFIWPFALVGWAIEKLIIWASRVLG